MTEPSGGAVERTWRPPLATRVSQVVACATLAALPGGFVALALWISLVPNGPWIALALWLAAGGALARRLK